MRNWHCILSITAVLGLAASGLSAQTLAEEIEVQLSLPILEHRQLLSDTQAYAVSRIPDVPDFTNLELWEESADAWRQAVLEDVVFKGSQAKSWRDADTEVLWQETIEGGPGYSIQKLAYEALPGMWVPALLYKPTELEGRVPVNINVTGHEQDGFAADYKQLRCINQAKRGMLALSLEWFGFGHLAAAGFEHSLINQLDLCGASGIAPHYLGLSRAVDLALDHPNVDPQRVAVTGLSGGGWQTILISALDTRVTLCNPVAGYSSLKTRAFQLRDLGDSEQLPVDLATVVDYTHLTAMLAPRPALLTYNAADRCCFNPETTLPPLLDAAEPIYALYSAENNFAQHINIDPGTHNFEQDNREAIYGFLGEHFFPNDASYTSTEIDSAAEVKTFEQLTVSIPEDNLDFLQLASQLSLQLPRQEFLPPAEEDPETVEHWRSSARERLTELVGFSPYPVVAEEDGSHSGTLNATRWRLRLNDEWTVPVVEFSPASGVLPENLTILVHDQGRTALASAIESLVSEGNRVLVVDPFYFGESEITTDSIVAKDWTLALMIGSVGERPIGIQASQIAAIARWASENFELPGVQLQSFGKRSSLFSLIASALEPVIDNLEEHGAADSLRESITVDDTARTSPELFCFGLLEQFDISQLRLLSAQNSPSKQAPSLQWATPEPIIFGDALNDSQLNASADIPGEFVYSPPAGAQLDAGAHTLLCQFTPDDLEAYLQAQIEVTITVLPRTPVISWEPPEPITYGAPLDADQLDATADVPGSFIYLPSPGTVLPAGVQTLTVTFNPSDEANFTEATTAILIQVTLAKPDLTWDSPAPIVFGTPLNSTQLNARSNIDGTFEYSPDTGSVLTAGEHELEASFTPLDSQNFTTATTSVSIQVEKRRPEITWPNPLEITAGSAIEIENIPFTADVPGQFTFDPVSGTRLSIGTHTLNVTFTPTDSQNHLTATIRTSITVIAPPGDLSADGILNNEDLQDFIEAILDPAAYVQRTDRDPLAADMNGDGSLSIDDIDPFATALSDSQNLSPLELERLAHLSALSTPDGDSDQDGSSNAQELIAGTNPFDPNDRFRILSILAEEQSTLVEWSSVPGKTYAIESSSSLTDAWENLTETPIEANSSKSRFEVIQNSTSSDKYFRIRLLPR